jgi:hypothetical protein
MGRAAVVVKRQRGRVVSARRITRQPRPIKPAHPRTGALSRSTAVPLPNWGSLEASQWAMGAALGTCKF